MTPLLGLTPTYVPDLLALGRALSAMRADLLKVCPWGLPGGWTPTTRGQAARMASVLLYRTLHGDPSAYDGRHAHPYDHDVEREALDWLAVRPDLVVEIGNEPNVGPPVDMHGYAHHLDKAIDKLHALRQRFPQLQILPPALSIDPRAPDVDAWLTVLGPQLRRPEVNGFTVHAYSEAQLERGLALAEQHAPGKSVWVTEFGLNQELPAPTRGREYWRVLRDAPIHAAVLYHLDMASTPALAVQGPEVYRLAMDTLAALGQRDEPTREDTPVDHWPDIRVDGFAMDVRRWRTVEDFRAHLARYSYANTAPWAQGCVIHHTYRPLASQWRGWISVRGLAVHYRTAKNPPWSSGPQLFICPNAPLEADRGIWQLTPLNMKGIHAGNANATHWGVEHVGDFTHDPMPPDVVAMGAGAVAALLDWAGKPTTTTTVAPHAAHGKAECPGYAVDMHAYRRAVDALRRR